MSRVELHRVTAAPLHACSLTFAGGGVYSIVSRPETFEQLARLVTGLARPKRGRVRIDGENPFARPRLRARVAAVLRSEPRFTTATVADHLTRLLRVRGEARRAEAWLEEQSLGALAGRPGASLDDEERRRIALALALSLPEPVLLALYEPLALEVDRAATLAALRARAAHGTVVLCSVSSERDALDLGAERVALVSAQGKLAPLLEKRQGPGASPLRVRTSDPRRFSAEVATREAVSGVRGTLDEPWSEVVVEGNDAEAVSLAVLSAVDQSGVTLLSITSAAAPGSMKSAERGGRS